MLLPFYSEILNQEVKAGHEYVFLIYPKQYQYFWISQQDCRAQGKTKFDFIFYLNMVILK